MPEVKYLSRQQILKELDDHGSLKINPQRLQLILESMKMLGFGQQTPEHEKNDQQIQFELQMIFLAQTIQEKAKEERHVANQNNKQLYAAQAELAIEGTDFSIGQMDIPGTAPKGPTILPEIMTEQVEMDKAEMQGLNQDTPVSTRASTVTSALTDSYKQKRVLSEQEAEDARRRSEAKKRHGIEEEGPKEEPSPSDKKKRIE